MKIWGRIFAGVIICGGLVVSASAAERSERWDRHHINQRQRDQQQRIAQGIQSGQLTPREAQRLEREQYRFNREESRFRASGDGLSPRERARLEEQQDRMSRQIYHQKHDRQRGF
jgi:biopolymer transport protein ExbB/TolQ